uniref:Uncharacterized protein n=1 Tax=Tetranychus urticae TaxID=32264 RepID=T1L4M2_TETUR
MINSLFFHFTYRWNISILNKKT